MPFGSRIKLSMNNPNYQEEYQASLQQTAETAVNPLTRYRAKEMIGLLDTVGRITEFDYPLMLRTLDFIEVRPPDKLSFVFQCGIRITV